MSIYVFGLGHIGLPLAASISLCGKQVYGIDINVTTIENIKNGKVNMYEYYKGTHISKIVKELFDNGQLIVSSQFKRINNEPSVFIITVGIGVKEDNSQDLSPIHAVLKELMSKLVPKDLLIFRTTMIPGTCEKFIAPELKALNIPVYLAYCPETISETHAFEEFENNAKVLAGINEESYEAAEAFLNSLSSSPIYKASNIRTAEMIKVTQNIARDVDIALMNELSEAASALNVDVYELINLANTHPRIHLLEPGPGVGGYCLPNALGYLKEALTNKNTSVKLMETARNINNEKPHKVVEAVTSALKSAGKEIKNSSVALIGLAMKDCCADCRLSPSLAIAAELIDLGAAVKAYDSLVPHVFPYQVSSLKECIENADCILITVKQPGVKLNLEEMNKISAKPLIVVDTRNVFSNYSGFLVFKV